eukprot:Opistho-1_new@92081
MCARQPHQVRRPTLGPGTGAAGRTVEECHLAKRHARPHGGQAQALVGRPQGHQGDVARLDHQQVVVGVARAEDDAVGGHVQRLQQGHERVGGGTGHTFADFAQQVTLGARRTLLDGALRKDAGLGPFQRAVQVGKGAHMFACVVGGQGVERCHGGRNALLAQVAHQRAQLGQRRAVPGGHAARVQNHPTVARLQQHAHLLGQVGRHAKRHHALQLEHRHLVHAGREPGVRARAAQAPRAQLAIQPHMAQHRGGRVVQQHKGGHHEARHQRAHAAHHGKHQGHQPALCPGHARAARITQRPHQPRHLHQPGQHQPTRQTGHGHPVQPPRPREGHAQHDGGVPARRIARCARLRQHDARARRAGGRRDHARQSTQRAQQAFAAQGQVGVATQAVVQLQFLVEDQNFEAVDQRHQEGQHHQGRALLLRQGHPGDATPVGQRRPGKHTRLHGRHQHGPGPAAPPPCRRHSQRHHGHCRQQARHARPAASQPPSQPRHGPGRQRMPAKLGIPGCSRPSAKAVAHLAHVLCVDT